MSGLGGVAVQTVPGDHTCCVEKMSEEKESVGPLLSLNPKLQGAFQERVRNIRKKNQKTETLTPGIIYIGHIPRLLFEPQLKEYFSQFGTVTRLRLSRSKKTGNHKGYAYIEFECEEVAKIVADTMNNYLFCERLLKCEFVPLEKVNPKLFIGCNSKFKKPCQPAVGRYNMERNEKQQRKMMSRMLEKERKLRKRLAEKGIDYDFPGFAAEMKKSKTLSDDADDTFNSEAPTPVCTPNILERRKSARLGAPEEDSDDDDDDDEIVLKLPEDKTPAKKKSKPSKSTPLKTPEDSDDDELVIHLPEDKMPPKRKSKSTPLKTPKNSDDKIAAKLPEVKSSAKKKSKPGKSVPLETPKDSDEEIAVKLPEVTTSAKKISKPGKPTPPETIMDSDEEIAVKLPEVKTSAKKISKPSKPTPPETIMDSEDEIVLNVPQAKTPSKKRSKPGKSTPLPTPKKGDDEIAVNLPKSSAKKKSNLNKSVPPETPKDSDEEAEVKLLEVKTTSKKKPKLTKSENRMKIKKLKLQTN
ncbi:MKI67 FHA domain-interacting nucleolar phosphoprotein isoform X3 [Rana temporaria]|uniref:MKI67 FHA domain-interacting nucleolar phosphoprotein isoform X3 n=1 Tax=Rana temporaria TaxID=8407 RepID=UPI001AACDF1E|nr:MKI67 FHA domain-interacting nucleolar phosphoprotein isoform X3 [Rana temporaria]